MAKRSRPKVFIETSVFIRFLTRDDEQKFQTVYALFSAIESGEVRAATSNVVLLEVIYVLSRVYGFPQTKVMAAVKTLQSMRSLQLVEKTNSTDALLLWEQTKLPYGDCLIATQLPKNALLATFDKDFKKVSVDLYKW